MADAPINTVTVLSSRALARPDGRGAMLLDTKELGAIAFEVDQRAIDLIRRELAEIEKYLSGPKGNA